MAGAAGIYYLSDSISTVFSATIPYVVNTMKGLTIGAGAGMAALMTLMMD